MAIFSKIKSAVSKTAQAVKKAFSGGSNAASVSTAFSSLPGVATSTPTGLTTTSGQSISPSIFKSATPVTLPGSVLQKGVSSGALSVSPVGAQPTVLFGGQRSSGAPTVTGSTPQVNTRFAADTMTGGSTPSSFEGGATSNVAQITLPGTPGYPNMGPVGLADVAGTLSGQWALNPETGQMEPVPQETIDKESEKKASAWEKMLKKYGPVPEQENVYEDPKVLAQEEQVRKRQEEVNNYTSQLNAVIAEQNSRLINTRDIGAREGVTEGVYSAQENAINHEAAIKALPLKAALSTAQGNLELAQNYLTDITKRVSARMDIDYKYKVAKFNAIKDFVEGEDKIKLAELTKKNDRAYQEKRDLVNFAQSLALKAIETKQSGLVSTLGRLIGNPDSPTFANDLATVASQISKADGTGLNVSGFTEDQAKNLSGYLGEVPTYKSRDEAIAALNQYKAKIIVDTGQAGYDQVAAEIDRQFPPTPESPAVSNQATGAYGAGQSLYPAVKLTYDTLKPENLIEGGGDIISGIGNFFKGLTGN